MRSQTLLHYPVSNSLITRRRIMDILHHPVIATAAVAAIITNRCTLQPVVVAVAATVVVIAATAARNIIQQHHRLTCSSNIQQPLRVPLRCRNKRRSGWTSSGNPSGSTSLRTSSVIRRTRPRPRGYAQRKPRPSPQCQRRQAPVITTQAVVVLVTVKTTLGPQSCHQSLTPCVRIGRLKVISVCDFRPSTEGATRKCSGQKRKRKHGLCPRV